MPILQQQLSLLRGKPTLPRLGICLICLCFGCQRCLVLALVFTLAGAHSGWGSLCRRRSLPSFLPSVGTVNRWSPFSLSGLSLLFLAAPIPLFTGRYAVQLPFSLCLRPPLVFSLEPDHSQEAYATLKLVVDSILGDLVNPLEKFYSGR